MHNVTVQDSQSPMAVFCTLCNFTPNKHYNNKNIKYVQLTFALACRQCSTAAAIGSSANSAKPDNDDSRTPMDFSSATRNSDTVVEPSKLTTLCKPRNNIMHVNATKRAIFQMKQGKPVTPLFSSFNYSKRVVPLGTDQNFNIIPSWLPWYRKEIYVVDVQ